MTWPRLRDIILFFSGLLGVAYEAATHHAERPTLLLLYAGMMGLPAFLRQDSKNGKNGRPGHERP
jgi:hypothetical protein